MPQIAWARTIRYNLDMRTLQATPQTITEPVLDRWSELVNRAVQGEQLSSEDGLAILRSSDDELLEVLSAAYRVRRQFWGNQVRLNFLVNAKSGACAEDCGYCSQSRVSQAAIARHGLLPAEQILAGAQTAFQRQAKTYCIVTSGRAPGGRELDLVADVVPKIKRQYNLEICVSAGLLDNEKAQQLKQCGVDRVNHNLNTSRRFYPQICTTHTYQDRLDTLRAVRNAGLEICSGGIVGMGEEDADVVELALELGRLGVEALPVNFFLPIEGTPVTERGKGTQRVPGPHLPERPGGGHHPQMVVAQMGTVPFSALTPRYCLKVLALFRLANPRADLRVAAGREVHLGQLQPLALYAANSMFVGDYLTSKGQPPAEDYRMIEDLGFQVVEE